MKLILQELDGSTTFEKYVIKQTKGLLLLPCAIALCCGLSKVGKNIRHPADAEMHYEFGMKNATAIDLALLEQSIITWGLHKKLSTVS